MGEVENGFQPMLVVVLGLLVGGGCVWSLVLDIVLSGNYRASRLRGVRCNRFQRWIESVLDAAKICVVLDRGYAQGSFEWCCCAVAMSLCAAVRVQKVPR